MDKLDAWSVTVPDVLTLALPEDEGLLFPP